MAAPEPIVQIESVAHRYGERQALGDVTLTLYLGEVLGLLGPNGSGKTTLFRLLAGLCPIQAGRIRILGQEVATRNASIRAELGVVFQSPALDLQLTAEENLRHHGHLFGLRGSALRGRIETLLGQFGLGQRRRELTRTLSGGMRRRVELAKALLTDPAVLLMDEPSVGLDLAARLDFWRILEVVRKTRSLAILLTTHLMDDAERCSRIAILDRGRILACDTPEAMKAQIGGDVITLTGPDLPALQAGLREQFGLEAQRIDAMLRLERAAAHRFVPQLVESLPGLIDSVSIGKPTLEDVFTHTTGHALTPLPSTTETPEESA